MTSRVIVTEKERREISQEHGSCTRVNVAEKIALRLLPTLTAVTGDLDRLGPRSDVYSLGATLYCLLTGKPPFEGRDLGAILRAVQEGEFPRPREVDPAVDAAWRRSA